MRFVLMAAAALLALSFPVHAEEKSPDAPPAAAAETPAPAPEVKFDNPHLKEMNDQAEALSKTLTKEEAALLGQIRDNFGIIRSIEVARKSVKQAAAMCSEKNPDLKDEMTKHQKEWHENIGASLDRQQKSLDKSITKKRFADPKAIKTYFETIDNAARFADNDIEKTIVTSPEACKNLMNSMAETQKTITGMLDAMTWPEDAPVEPVKEAAPDKSATETGTPAP